MSTPLHQQAPSVSVTAPAFGPGSYNPQAHQMILSHMIEINRIKDKIEFYYLQQQGSKNARMSSPHRVAYNTTLNVEEIKQWLNHFKIYGLCDLICDQLAQALLDKVKHLKQQGQL